MVFCCGKCGTRYPYLFCDADIQNTSDLNSLRCSGCRTAKHAHSVSQIDIEVWEHGTGLEEKEAADSGASAGIVADKVRVGMDAGEVVAEPARNEIEAAPKAAEEAAPKAAVELPPPAAARCMTRLCCQLPEKEGGTFGCQLLAGHTLPGRNGAGKRSRDGHALEEKRGPSCGQLVDVPSPSLLPSRPLQASNIPAVYPQYTTYSCRSY